MSYSFCAAHPGKFKIGYVAHVAYAVILLNIVACTGVPTTYYDAKTYTQLVNLKAETTKLVESFDTNPYSENRQRIEETTWNLKAAYEYEKGKGSQNIDITRQLEIIYGLFMDDVKDYRENRAAELGDKYFQEAARILGQAFDVAISTENAKNRGRG